MFSLKAGKNPAYDYFFFFESLISFFVGGLRNFDKPNEIVVVEVGSPIFFHSSADTFFKVIYTFLLLRCWGLDFFRKLLRVVGPSTSDGFCKLGRGDFWNPL